MLMKKTRAGHSRNCANEKWCVICNYIHCDHFTFLALYTRLHCSPSAAAAHSRPYSLLFIWPKMHVWLLFRFSCAHLYERLGFRWSYLGSIYAPHSFRFILFSVCHIFDMKMCTRPIHSNDLHVCVASHFLGLFICLCTNNILIFALPFSLVMRLATKNIPFAG